MTDPRNVESAGLCVGCFTTCKSEGDDNLPVVLALLQQFVSLDRAVEWEDVSDLGVEAVFCDPCRKLTRPAP